MYALILAFCVFCDVTNDGIAVEMRMFLIPFFVHWNTLVPVSCVPVLSRDSVELHILLHGCFVYLPIFGLKVNAMWE